MNSFQHSSLIKDLLGITKSTGVCLEFTTPNYRITSILTDPVYETRECFINLDYLISYLGLLSKNGHFILILSLGCLSGSFKVHSNDKRVPYIFPFYTLGLGIRTKHLLTPQSKLYCQRKTMFLRFSYLGICLTRPW